MPLGLCPNCGMDSGERVAQEGNQDRFLVICRLCGCHTKAYCDQASASKAWQRGAVYIHGRRVGDREKKAE